MQQNGNDPKKAFTGKNSLEKNPIWLNDAHTKAVPAKVRTVNLDTTYSVRKGISPDLNVSKVVDAKIRRLLEARLEEFGGNADKAFTNLDENPIWLNQEQGICIKRVTIRKVINNVRALHNKRNKEGHLILNEHGNTIPVDFVDPMNNHHVAIYQKPKLDKKGMPVLDEDGMPYMELEERVVPFYDAVARINENLPAVDKNLNYEDGWRFLYTMKQNEYFVFPNEATGFNPKDIDLLNPDNYALISPNLFRVQSISTKDYFFRHHLETKIEYPNELKGITWKRIKSLGIMTKIVKVRINHIGQIVAVGEY